MSRLGCDGRVVTEASALGRGWRRAVEWSTRVEMPQFPDMREEGSAPTAVDERKPEMRDDTPPPPASADTGTPPRRQAPATIPIETNDWEPEPSVERDRWVTRDELLSTSQHAVYGTRSPYARKRRRPLPQPKRFRKVPRWQSWSVLFLATILSLVILYGAVRANPFGAKSLPPAATATSTVAHQATATATVKPTK